MKKRFVSCLVMLFCMALMSNFVFAAEKGAKPQASANIKAGNILYVCDCTGCKCNTVSKNPGNCTCSKELVPMHVLKIESGEAILCACGKGCDCKISADDPTKCGCGKQVKRVSLKGMYVCSCGSGCMCNTISDKPGKCSCGKELKRIE